MAQVSKSFGDWKIRRAAWAYRQWGNRDLYLEHPDGARAMILPVVGGGFMATMPGGSNRAAQTRRGALAIIREDAQRFYEAGVA